MDKNIDRKILVKFSEVFDAPPQSLKVYLTGISRKTLVDVTTFFLGFFNKNSQFNSYKSLLEMFFRRENNELANQIYQKLNNIRESTKKELVIINPLSSLQLFEYCFDNLTDDETQTLQEAEVNIFKAYILLNEQITAKEMTAGSSTENVSKGLRIAAMSLSQAFSYSELINYSLSELMSAQIIKSIYLFEFLESNPTTQPLLNKFLSHFGCADWKDFLKKFLPLPFTIIKKANEAYIDINVELGANFEKECEFIRKLAITDIETVNDYDFKKIRGRPFYEIKDGTFRVIYDLFVIELIHKGLYFKLDEINKTLPEREKIKNFRSMYCDEFSEKKVLYKTLNSIYRNKYIEFSGQQIKELTGIEAEPDYYIRKGNHLFLFESKDILIKAEIKHSYDFELYESEFKKKLYFEEKKGKIENKAVLQLINNVKRLLLKQFSFDMNYKEKSLTIYPILVLHDHQFNVTGLNLLVKSWFKEELSKLSAEGIDISKVKPITIIDIDTFIFHQDILRDRTIKLEDMLEDYCKYSTFDEKKRYTNEDYATIYLMRTIVPFSFFLSNIISSRRIMRVPKMLMEKGVSLFQ